MNKIQIIKPFKILPKPWGNETWLYSGEGDTPFLLKIIRADQPLSVQVHPTDDYARRYEKQSGKTESWVVLETSGDDPCLYLGFSKPTTKEKFRELAKKPKEEFFPILNKISIKPGDVFDVPAGWIHAIGGGVVLLEIQQVSDVTYRIWDWGRSSREMHIEKALDVLDFEATRPIRPEPKKMNDAEEQLIFRPESGYALNKISSETTIAPADRDVVLVLVSGQAKIDGETLMPGCCVLVPKNSGKIPIQSSDSTPPTLFMAYKP